MMKPADGIEGIKQAVLTAVKEAGPNACPPMVVGVGIGGTFEKCALLAKKALTRSVKSVPRSLMFVSWRRKYLRRSIAWESALEDLEEA